MTDIEAIRSQMRLWKVGVANAVVPDHVDWLLAEVEQLTAQRDAVLALVHSDQPYIRRKQLLDALGVTE